MTPPVRPGATIGIFGGGQLGRMTGFAARSMGYDVRVLDPDPRAPARPIASASFTAAFDDAGAADEMANGCGVVTVEIETIAVSSLEAASRHAPVRPSGTMLHVAQDRARQKAWLSGHGFPLGPFAIAESATTCADAIQSLGGRVIVKSSTGGYDGRGQARVTTTAEAAAAWTTMGGRTCVVERQLDLALELSVLVARRPSGHLVVYPPALNHHESGILRWSVLPGAVPAPAGLSAQRIASAIAEQFDLEGLLATEFFVTTDGELFVNEIAPRPHNSYHGSERACSTGQFEQHVRAICDLPLGEVTLARPTAIVNLLGDLWVDGAAPDFAAALVVPGVRLHLYGKGTARAGRKMGHLSATASDGEAALACALAAYHRLEAVRR